MSTAHSSSSVQLFRNTAIISLLLILASCGQEPQTSPEPALATDQAASLAAEESTSAPNLALVEPAELFADLPTHWINENPIGDNL